MAVEQRDTTAAREVVLPITGMTCASCVRRVERALGKVAGVQDASVNLATEKARVVFDPEVAHPDALKQAVEKAGYGVREDPPEQLRELTLPVTGMTCASCVRRVERAIGKLEGVEGVSVNLATEKATVRFHPELVGHGALRGAVEKAGYGLGEPEADDQSITAAVADREAEERGREIRDLRIRFTVSLAIGLGMMALMYLPVPWTHAQLAIPLLILATPVQFWAGWPFYRHAWAAARHFTTNMNTLVAMGTSAAYLYSAFVSLFPDAVRALGLQPQLYYETAVIIIALILLGRWLEARAKGQTSAAIKKLMGLQPRTARVVRDGQETDIPIEEVRAGDLVRVRPSRLRSAPVKRSSAPR